MKNLTSNKIVQFWENGYLYIATAFIIQIVWAVSDNVGVLDWIKEIAYFEYFKTSFNDFHSLPYFWWNILEEVAWRPPIPGTSAIIAIPETALFSPLTPLLYLISAKVYIKLYIFIQFLIGVFGLIILKKKINWNNAQFRIFTVLFLFSPIIMQHIAVAYFTWYNFYLFPWLIYFVADRRAAVGIVGTAAVLGLIVLQGGIYIVQYVGLFYVLYELLFILFEREWKRITRIFMVPLLAVLFSFARIYITGYSYGEYIRPWVEIDGYNIPFFLFYALIPTVTIPPINLFFHTDFLGWSLTPHDSGQFWGLAIFMLAVVVIRYKKLILDAKSTGQNNLNYKAILIAASVLFIISFYQIWYLLMRLVSVLDIPLFESIKNHGIRFIMGSYFGFALVLANYSDQIWKELHHFVNTKLWNISKSFLLIIFKAIFFVSGTLVITLKLFRTVITKQFTDVIAGAYNNTAHFWLRKRMEGINENSLEFYYFRFDVAYSAIFHWIFVIFCVFFFTFVLILFFRKKRKLFKSIVIKFPNIKFELALAIPLIFSTAMWANLAASVPYSNYPILPLVAPQLIVDSKEDLTPPKVEVNPQKIIITPTKDGVINGYTFHQVPASDIKHFKITSKNAIFLDNGGQMMLKPLDNKPIEMQFRTGGIRYSLIITLATWALAALFMASVYIKKKKLH